MPIRINLLAEAQIAEDLRRRDPVKRAIFGGALLVVLALAWSSSLQLGVMISKRELGQIQGTIEQRNGEWQKVVDSQKKIYDIRAKLNSLQQLTASRFLQGNFMNALQHLNLDGVQLVRVRTDQSFFKVEAVPAAKSNDAHAQPGHPAMVAEKIRITLDARDISASPGDQVNKFKDAIAGQSYFKSNLNPTNGVQLVSLSPMATGTDGRPYVPFTLQWDLPQQDR
jgi:hypothetical protein